MRDMGIGRRRLSGGPSPRSWVYRLQLDGPSLSETVTRPRAAVLHFKLSADRRRPWCGLSPLDWAIETGSLNGALEKSLSSEASMPVGALVPMPEGTKVSETFKTALNNLAGKVALPETASGGHGDLAQAPRRDWDPRRLGPAPTAAEVDLRMQTEVSICALYGISPSTDTNGRIFRSRSYRCFRARTRYRASVHIFLCSIASARPGRKCASGSCPGAIRHSGR